MIHGNYYYYRNNKNENSLGWIIKFNEIKTCSAYSEGQSIFNLASVNLDNYGSFYTNDEGGDSRFHDIKSDEYYDLRPATPDEIRYLDECIENGKKVLPIPIFTSPVEGTIKIINDYDIF
jgi:hypothetical protein